MSFPGEVAFVHESGMDTKRRQQGNDDFDIDFWVGERYGTTNAFWRLQADSS